MVDPMQLWGSLTQQFQQIAASALKDVGNNAAMNLGKTMAAGMTRAAAKTTAAASKKTVAKKAPAKKTSARKATGK
jgi:hypothetical protein